MSAQSDPKISVWKLIAVPVLISVLMTILRVTGEVRHWSERWFSTATGGFDPTGVSWVFGMTWLAVPFGVYFAWRLLRAGAGVRLGRASGMAVLGIAVIFASRLVLPWVPIGFPRILLVIWGVMAAAALLQLFGWPELFRVLLAYGVASRIPVVIVYFAAMAGDWRTHYDYVDMPPQFQMELIPRFLWLGFFPQLIFWVGFTIVAGSVTGSLTAVALRARRPAAGRAEV